jgi:cytochrome P450
MISEVEIEEIYTRHLKKFFSGASDNLFQCFINAAMEVVFTIFNLPKNTYWPPEVTDKIRELLNVHQMYAWGQASQEQYLDSEKDLQRLSQEISSAWKAEPRMNALLQEMAAKVTFAAFDPAKELIQVFQAASETTASTLLWVVDSLLRYPNARNAIAHEESHKARDAFIKEVLRLYPPLPCVTRFCTQDVVMGSTKFQQGEFIIVSLVGIHCHPSYWTNPREFDPMRKEFVGNSFVKEAYIPFLSGPRSCGGMRLANLELKIALNVLLKYCEFSAFQLPVRLNYGVISRPGNLLDPYLKLRTT